MLPQRPAVLDPDFASSIPPIGTARPATDTIDHHSQICPTCNARLIGHRCKLVCTQCGYYLSCADYY